MAAARRRRPGRPKAIALLVVFAALLVVAAAGYAVLRPRPLAIEPAAAGADPACARVAAAWPRVVAGRERAPVAQDPAGVAAWGEPAIVARCGVPAPPPTTHDCIAADGVDWVARPLPAGQGGGGTLFLSYGRDPAIEVRVPAAYAPEPLALGAFAEAARQIPQGPHRCT